MLLYRKYSVFKFKHRVCFTLIQDYTLVKTFQAHQAAISALTLLENDNIASASEDKMLLKWNTNYVVQNQYKFTSVANSMLTFSNGREIACGMTDNSIIIFNTTSNQINKVLVGHQSKITSLALIGDVFLASGSQDLTLKVWNLTAGAVFYSFQVNQYNSESVNALAILKNGQLAAGTDFSYIYIYDLNGFVKQITLLSNIFALCELKSGYLASGLANGMIEIWDVMNSTQKATLSGHTNSVRSLAVLRNGYLASGSDDQTIRIWDTELNKHVMTLTGHSGNVVSLIVLSNGYLVSGSRDTTVKIWSFY